MKTYERALTLEEMAQVSDDEIDTSDIPELDDEFWERAAQIRAEAEEKGRRAG